MTNYLKTAKRLQKAIKKQFGIKLLLNSSEWYSKDRDRAVTVYTLRQAVWDESKQRYVNVEMFKTYSQVQLVLFLRDYWYELNGREIPTDNQKWQEVKKQYAETKLPNDIEPCVNVE